MEMCVHATIGSIAAQAHKSLLEKEAVDINVALGKISAFWKRCDDQYEVTVKQFLPRFAADNPTVSEAATALIE